MAPSALKRKMRADDRTAEDEAEDNDGLVPISSQLKLANPMADLDDDQAEAAPSSSPVHNPNSDSVKDVSSPVHGPSTEQEVITPSKNTRYAKGIGRTVAAKKKAGKLVVPTEAEFNKMKAIYESIKIALRYRLTRDQPLQFRTMASNASLSIFVLPHDPDLNKAKATKNQRLTVHELWKVRILDIKEDAKGHTWLLIRWFWSKEDLVKGSRENKWELSRSFLNSIGNNELVECDHTDIISYESCEASVELRFVDFSDVNQENPHSFYSRSNLMVGWSNNRAKVKGERHTCLNNGKGNKFCTGTYSPDTDVQHFCATCNRWYHVGCMERESWGPRSAQEVEEEFGDAAIDLVEKVTPWEEHQDSLRAAYTTPNKRIRLAPTSPSRNTRSSMSKAKKSAGGLIPRHSGPVKRVPPSAVRVVAQMQIIRGSGIKYGVVGNAKLVCGARLVVQDFALGRMSSGNLNPSWLAEIESQKKPKIKGFYHCGQCQSLI